MIRLLIKLNVVLRVTLSGGVFLCLFFIVEPIYAESNNSCQDADVVSICSTFSGSLKASGSWSNRDPYDYFKFNSGAASGPLTVAVNSKKEVKVTVWESGCDQNGQVKGQESGKTITIDITLTAGTSYYIKVDAISNGNISYNVTLTHLQSCGNLLVDDDGVQCPGAAYDNITDALLNAPAGATINVCAGTYNENLFINKGLTLQSMSGDRDDVIVTNNASKPIVQISGANGVTIKNMTISQNHKDHDALQISSYSQNITLEGLKIIASRDGVMTERNNGRLTMSDLEIVAGGDGIDFGGTVNGGVTIETLAITAAEQGIKARSTINSGLSITDCNVVSEGTAIDLQKVNGGLSIAGIKLTSQQKGILFQEVLNGDVTIDDSVIESHDTSLEFVANVNTGLVISNVSLISSNGGGIDIGGDVFGTGFTADGLIIEAQKEGLLVGSSKTEVRATLSITNSSILSHTDNAFELHIPGWDDALIENNCLFVSTSNSYALSLNTSGNSTDTIARNNCFYAPDVNFLVSANRSGHFFSNNYWDGFSGNSFSFNNVLDESPVSLCQNPCGVKVSAVVADYRFNECQWNGTTGTVVDSSGNGHSGTAYGGVEPSVEAGKLCRGGEFDGVDDYIEVAYSTTLYSGQGLSFSAWIYSAKENQMSKVVEIGDWDGHGLGLYPHDDGLFVHFRINDETKSLNVGSRPELNRWYHVAGTYDGKDIKLYVDGVLLKTQEVVGTLTVKNRSLYVGGTAGQKFFNGLIDEVMVFDGALSATQIEEMYRNYNDDLNYDGSVVDCAPCQGFCFFDDFNRETLGSNWSVIESVNYSPQVVNDRLMLTDNGNNIASGITLNGRFPARDNYIEIEFEHNSYGGSGGDGMVVVLSNANVAPAVGGNGGSLGYADKHTSSPGFKGAWLGFAIDEFGNFSNNSEGRYGGVGQVRDSVAVRGHGDGYDDYRYLAGTASLDPGVDDRNSTLPSPGYLYRFSIDTRNNQARIKAERDLNDGSGYSDLIGWYSLSQDQVNHVPEFFQLSLTAGSGGSKNYHSIDNIAINAMNCGTLTGGIDHFEFIHDGHALTCMAEQVTLKACANEDCSDPYVGGVNVTLSNIGWLNGTSQTLNFPADGTGVALSFHHTTAGDISLNVESSDPAASGVICRNGGSDSCTIKVAESGFLLTVDNGRSCADLSGTIQAVKQNDDATLCVGDEGFDGTTRDIGFWFNYSAPSPTSDQSNPSVNGTELGQNSPGTGVEVTFDNNASADFYLNYADAGSLNLFARFAGQDDEQNLLLEGSTAEKIVVAPHHFEVTSPFDNSTATGTPKVAAGLFFAATITAVCENGMATPNFAAATALTAVSPHAPAGVLGALANGSLALTDFNSGEATASLSYDEVGNFTLQAKCEEYLGTSMDVLGTQLIGRFHPAYFKVEGNEPQLASGCSAFTWLDQLVYYNTPPIVTISARNATGDVTKNYVGANWWKLADVIEIYTDSAVPSGVAINHNLAGHSPQTSSANTNTPGQVTVTFNGPLRWQRPNVGNVEPFYSKPMLEFNVEDGDAAYNNPSDNSARYRLPIEFTSSHNEMRHGRLRLINAHGSELLPLKLPVVTEYFNGAGFVANRDDNCSTLATDLSDFTFSTGDGIADADNLTQVTAGQGSLDWTAPAYPVGHVDVWVDLSALPWLQYDWDGDGGHFENPLPGRATFGIYQGNEHIIYMRETTWR